MNVVSKNLIADIAQLVIRLEEAVNLYESGILPKHMLRWSIDTIEDKIREKNKDLKNGYEL